MSPDTEKMLKEYQTDNPGFPKGYPVPSINLEVVELKKQVLELMERVHELEKEVGWLNLDVRSVQRRMP